MCEGNPLMQEASILSIRLCLNVKHKYSSFHYVYVSNYHIHQYNVMYGLEAKAKNKFEY